MKEKIRVLFFISSLAGGGAEKVMVSILTHIDREKIDPSLLLLYPFGDSPYREYLPGDARVKVVARKSDSFPEKVQQLINFMRAVHREKPRIIVSSLTHNNIMAILARIFFGAKVIACEHIVLGNMIRTRKGKRILGLPTASLVKSLYRFADKVIVVSEGIKMNLVEDFHVPEHKIQIIYNPIDLDRITTLRSLPAGHPFFEERKPVIVAAGRLVSQKRFDTLIEAFGMIQSVVDARLIILGEGPEEEALRKLAENRGIKDKVSLAGFQRNPYSFISGADVFVLSSGYEGLPMVMLEAMACGTPVISTDCKSGPGELLEGGRCGLLVPVGDAEALSKSIVKLLRDKTLREKFSNLGRERARDFSVDKIIRQYEREIYESLRD